jgi:hypothetical protein
VAPPVHRQRQHGFEPILPFPNEVGDVARGRAADDLFSVHAADEEGTRDRVVGDALGQQVFLGKPEGDGAAAPGLPVLHRALEDGRKRVRSARGGQVRVVLEAKVDAFVEQVVQEARRGDHVAVQGLGAGQVVEVSGPRRFELPQPARRLEQGGPVLGPVGLGSLNT